MSKALTELTVEIITALLSHRDMSPDEIADGLKKIFYVLKALNNLESRKEPSSAEIEAISGKLAEWVAVETDSRAAKKSAGAGPDQRKPPAAAAFADPMDSIQAEKIFCLECGREFKQISHTHLAVHGMTPKDYRKKYHLPAKQPLTARSLSEQRKQRAVESGLGSLLKSRREAKQKAD